MARHFETTWTCDKCGSRETFNEHKPDRPSNWAVLELSRAFNFPAQDKVYKTWVICHDCRLQFEGMGIA